MLFQVTSISHAAKREGTLWCCRALGAEQDGFVSYGKFRNFLILLPEAKLREADPSIAWFEAATMVPFGEAYLLHSRHLDFAIPWQITAE